MLPLKIMLGNFGVGVGFIWEEFSAFKLLVLINYIHFKELKKKYSLCFCLTLDNM